MTIAAIILGILVGGLFLVAGLNRWTTPAAVERETALTPPQPDDPIAAGGLMVATWNIGYGGMGAESDFVMDLGAQKRPLDAGLVERNAAVIATALAAMPADVLMLQEAARPSWNTYRHDVLGLIQSYLPEYAMAFRADIDTRGVPPPFNVRIGNAFFSKHAGAIERRGLPLEPTFEYGVFRKSYRMHILRLENKLEANWTLINVHLSAFDEPEKNVREAQLRAVVAFAQSEYAAGRHVVVGGDWNLRLAPTEFPHETQERFQFWIRDLPVGATPAGWQWATDPDRPTVRTAHKPYVNGENYRLIIDGFLVSPNIKTVSVRTDDLDFAASDHNPVTAVFHPKALEAGAP